MSTVIRHCYSFLLTTRQLVVWPNRRSSRKPPHRGGKDLRRVQHLDGILDPGFRRVAPRYPTSFLDLRRPLQRFGAKFKSFERNHGASRDRKVGSVDPALRQETESWIDWRKGGLCSDFLKVDLYKVSASATAPSEEAVVVVVASQTSCKVFWIIIILGLR